MEINKIYKSREEEIRAELTESEVINRIEKKYRQQYDPTSNLDAWDQLLACEAIEEATPVDRKHPDAEWVGKGLAFIGNDSDTCYPQVISKLSPDYLKAVSKLKYCSYKTPPIEISAILEETFGRPGKKGHWLWIAQHWNPRQITWVLNRMYKQEVRGDITIQNSAAYFTSLLKADGGDAARTRKQLSRLNGLLELIRAQYPAGALDPAALDHEDHSAAPGNARGVHAHGVGP